MAAGIFCCVLDCCSSCCEFGGLPVQTVLRLVRQQGKADCLLVTLRRWMTTAMWWTSCKTQTAKRCG